MDVMIDGLGVSGDGVGRLSDGRVVFVERALPGDRVRVLLTRTKKKVQYADLLEVLEPSPDRGESLCRDLRCGGCPLKGLNLKAQARLKRERVEQTMRRIAGLDVTDTLRPTVATAGDGWAYRHRVSLHASWVDERWMIGYYERRSRRLVPFSVCPVLWPELDEAIGTLREGLRDLPRAARLRRVEIAYSRRDARAAARIACEGETAAVRDGVDWERGSGLSGVDVQCGSRRWRFGNLELRYDHGAADKYDLLYEPGLFTQAHPEANDMLIEAVINAVRPREGPRVLELHAGVGNFTIPMARAGAVVQAVENNRRAVVLCRRNASSPGLQIDVAHESDAHAASLRSGYDVVVLDPPRTGARAAVETLATQRASRIVYVSCDPATFARDAAILQSSGYRITLMHALDLFPQTPHVEIVTTFEK